MKRTILTAIHLFILFVGLARTPNHSYGEMKIKRYFAIKTNTIEWMAAIMNVAIDVQVAKQISVEFPTRWSPWNIGNTYAIKTFGIQPEGRYWPNKIGKGHFVGLHIHLMWFNLKWNQNRYQDSNYPLLGAGISYGYVLPLGHHWAGEFSVGAGYAKARYDTFYNIKNGAWIDTRSHHYWGVTRAAISVVYHFKL